MRSVVFCAVATVVLFAGWLSVKFAYSQNSLSRRAAEVLHTYDTLSKPALATALLRYREGKFSTGDSIALAHSYLNKPSGDMFWLFWITAFSAYRRSFGAESGASDSVRTRIKDHVQRYQLDKGNTENHALLYNTGLYLLPELYPELNRPEHWFHGQSPDSLKQAACAYFHSWIRLVTNEGMAEFDSPTYFPEYMFCMALLHRFAPDSCLRNKCGQMMDWLLIDFALDHFDGMMLGGHSREGPTAVFTPRLGNASEFAYLYFGTGEHNPKLAWCVWVNALSGYEPPRFIKEIARCRRPILNRERHRTRDRRRHTTQVREPVYRTTYRNSEYGLSSIQGGILQPIQQHTWSVRFRGAKPYSTIFGLHPYWSNYELEMYFDDYKTVESVSREKPTYNQHTKWTGASPFESVFQHDNDLIALYNAPQGTESEHIDFFFPSTLNELKLLPSGWIAARAGRAYVGVFIWKHGVWMRLDEDEGNRRFRSSAAGNGCSVAVRSRGEIGSFRRFCKELEKSKPLFWLEDDTVRAAWKTLSGQELTFTFNGERAVNGVEAAWRHQKLFDSPYTDGNQGVLKVQWKAKTYIYSPSTECSANECSSQ